MRLINRNRYPIIIGGFYRSGTSLLRRILDAHSHIHCPPEIKFFRDFYGDYFTDDLKHLRFFTTLRSIGLSEEDLIEIYGAAFIRSHELAARRLHKKRWGDKTPENLLYLNSWFKLLRGKMFFIFVVRDPLDTIASLIEVGFPKTIPSAFEEKIELLKKYVEKGLSFAKEHSNISHVVRYEDIVQDSESTLVNLFHFIGEKFEEGVLENFSNKERQSGIEDPKILRERYIHDKSIGRGKNDLTDEQIRFTLHHCHSIIEKIGYGQILQSGNDSSERMCDSGGDAGNSIFHGQQRR
jgi:hypothetical protein